MEWTFPEIASSNRQRMVEELLQGREMANQLQRCGSGDVLSAEGLVTKILGSFTNTIRILNGIHETNKEELISQIQSNSATCSPVIGPAAAAGADLEKLISQMQFNSTTTSVSTTAWGVAAGADNALDPAGADLEKLVSQIQFNTTTTSLTTAWGADKAVEGAVKSDVPNVGNYGRAETLNIRRGHFKRRTETQKIRRACLDRRKTSWTKDTLGLVDDGHAWRKYGQKTTLNSRHPRYICEIATVIFIFLFLIITDYFDYLKARELIVDSSDSEDPSNNMIKFDTANDFNCKQHPFFASFTSIKRESVEEEKMIAPNNDHDHVTHHNQSLLLCDHLMSPDLGLFESSGSISLLSSTITYDHDDLISRIMEGCFDGHEVEFPY